MDDLTIKLENSDKLIILGYFDIDEEVLINFNNNIVFLSKNQVEKLNDHLGMLLKSIKD